MPQYEFHTNMRSGRWTIYLWRSLQIRLSNMMGACEEPKFVDCVCGVCVHFHIQRAMPVNRLSDATDSSSCVMGHVPMRAHFVHKTHTLWVIQWAWTDYRLAHSAYCSHKVKNSKNATRMFTRMNCIFCIFAITFFFFSSVRTFAGCCRAGVSHCCSLFASLFFSFWFDLWYYRPERQSEWEGV